MGFVLGHRARGSSQSVVVQASLVNFDMESLWEFRIMGESLCDGDLGSPGAPALVAAVVRQRIDRYSMLAAY